MKIFLIGFMGSGKTTLGRKTALRMGLNFIDLDEFIQSKEGKSIRQIFATTGEKEFRQIEAENLRLLEKIEQTIISVGGGAPCFYENMDWMNQRGFTIYLKQSPEFLYSRLKSSKSERPLIKGLKKKELYDFIVESLEERSVFYEKAKLILNAKNLKPKQLQEEIENALK
jgi:shikimate kinase